MENVALRPVEYYELTLKGLKLHREVEILNGQRRRLAEEHNWPTYGDVAVELRLMDEKARAMTQQAYIFQNKAVAVLKEAGLW